MMGRVRSACGTVIVIVLKGALHIRGGAAAQRLTLNTTVVGSIPIQGIEFILYSFPRSGKIIKCVVKFRHYT